MANLQSFVEYCWLFYAPKGDSGEIFEHNLTKAELEAACKLRIASHPDFCGDSVDREAVREILIFARKYASAAGFDGQENLFKRLEANNAKL